MNVRSRTFLIGASIAVGAVIAATLLYREPSQDEIPAISESTSPDAEKIDTELSPLKEMPAEEALPDTAALDSQLETEKTPYINKLMKQKVRKPRSEAPPVTLPPLPDAPFLAENTRVEAIPAPVEEEEEVVDVKPSSLNWFRADMGPLSMTQKQTDAVFSDTRSVTNPLTVNLCLGSSLSDTVGLEFGWTQTVTRSGSPGKTIPKNQLSGGISWQPKTVVKKSSYTRWGIGLSLEDAGYLSGQPGQEKVTSYSKTDIYAGVTHNRSLFGLWYLDMKVMMTMSPLKPSDFISYTDSAFLFEVTPQYEIDKNFRAGFNLGYASKQRKGQLYNYLGQKDSADIEHQEIKAGVSLFFTF